MRMKKSKFQKNTTEKSLDVNSLLSIRITNLLKGLLLILLILLQTILPNTQILIDMEIFKIMYNSQQAV